MPPHLVNAFVEYGLLFVAGLVFVVAAATGCISRCKGPGASMRQPGAIRVIPRVQPAASRPDCVAIDIDHSEGALRSQTKATAQRHEIVRPVSFGRWNQPSFALSTARLERRLAIGRNECVLFRALDAGFGAERTPRPSTPCNRVNAVTYVWYSNACVHVIVSSQMTSREVWLAKSCLDERDVVLRTFSPPTVPGSDVEDVTDRRAWEEHADLLESMDHPNIVKMYGRGTSPFPFVVMEYCAHGSLLVFLRTGNRRLCETVRTLAADVACAVVYIQQVCRIISWDLDARHILVDERMTAKIGTILTTNEQPPMDGRRMTKRFGALLQEMLAAIHLRDTALSDGERDSTCAGALLSLASECCGEESDCRPSMEQVLHRLETMRCSSPTGASYQVGKRAQSPASPRADSSGKYWKWTPSPKHRDELGSPVRQAANPTVSLQTGARQMQDQVVSEVPELEPTGGDARAALAAGSSREPGHAVDAVGKVFPGLPGLRLQPPHPLHVRTTESSRGMGTFASPSSDHVAQLSPAPSVPPGQATPISLRQFVMESQSSLVSGRSPRRGSIPGKGAPGRSPLAGPVLAKRFSSSPMAGTRSEGEPVIPFNPHREGSRETGDSELIRPRYENVVAN